MGANQGITGNLLQHTFKKSFPGKIFYLAGCSTCAAVIKETGIAQKKFLMQDIKTQPISAKQLDELKKLSGSYEALFSRRAVQYKALALKDKQLTEKDFRQYMLKEYTFLKRPVVVIDQKIFIGSEKKTVAALQQCLDTSSLR